MTSPNSFTERSLLPSGVVKKTFREAGFGVTFHPVGSPKATAASPSVSAASHAANTTASTPPAFAAPLAEASPASFFLATGITLALASSSGIDARVRFPSGVASASLETPHALFSDGVHTEGADIVAVSDSLAGERASGTVPMASRNSFTDRSFSPSGAIKRTSFELGFVFTFHPAGRPNSAAALYFEPAALHAATTTPNTPSAFAVAPLALASSYGVEPLARFRSEVASTSLETPVSFFCDGVDADGTDIGAPPHRLASQRALGTLPRNSPNSLTPRNLFPSGDAKLTCREDGFGITLHPVGKPRAIAAWFSVLADSSTSSTNPRTPLAF